jgi:hypothetical protein
VSLTLAKVMEPSVLFALGVVFVPRIFSTVDAQPLWQWIVQS